MAHKRKSTFTCALVFKWIFVATARVQDILAFNGTTGLPDCAYSCTELYSAQYDCQSAVDRVDCFCTSTYITSNAKSWGCDEVCAAELEKERVTAFLATTCGTEEEDTDGNTARDDDGDQENKVTRRGLDSRNVTSTVSSAPSKTTPSTPNGKDPQSNKAKNW
jgi:hypothetical protein